MMAICREIFLRVVCQQHAMREEAGKESESEVGRLQVTHFEFAYTQGKSESPTTNMEGTHVDREFHTSLTV